MLLLKRTLGLNIHHGGESIFWIRQGRADELTVIKINSGVHSNGIYWHPIGQQLLVEAASVFVIGPQS